MSFFISIILLISVSLNNEFSINPNQHSNFELEITLTNIKKPGNVFIAIYNNALDFNSGGDSINKMTYRIKETIVNQSFSKKIILKEGTYAFKVYIDNNNNNKLDFNFLGFPKEQFGFSNDVMSISGSPKFKASSFKLDSNKAIKTKMK